MDIKLTARLNAYTQANFNNFIYIKYSANEDGSDYTSEPQSDSKYIGVANGGIEPQDKADYRWSLYRGNGIKAIEGPVTSDLVDTYTIVFDNDETQTFSVTNGAPPLPVKVNISETDVLLTMENNCEYICENSITSLHINGFVPDAQYAENYTIIFQPNTANMEFNVPSSVVFPDSAPSSWDTTKTYYMAFIPVGPKYLGVWEAI